jgi:hypothetical protein
MPKTYYCWTGDDCQRLCSSFRILAKRAFAKDKNKEWVGEPKALEKGKLRPLYGPEEDELTEEFNKISKIS